MSFTFALWLERNSHVPLFFSGLVGARPNPSAFPTKQKNKKISLQIFVTFYSIFFFENSFLLISLLINVCVFLINDPVRSTNGANTQQNHRLPI